MTNNQEELFVSKEYKKYFEILLAGPFEGEEFIAFSRRAVREIAGILSVGKMVMEFNAPETAIMPNGEAFQQIIYQGDSYNESSCFFCEKITREGGIAKYKYYPVKGYIFSAQDKEKIDFSNQVLFAVGSRIRMSILLEKATNTDMMTGIPNLKAFLERLNLFMSENREKEYNAVFLNVKNFKYVNKLMEYGNGNAVMVQYAKKLNQFKEGDEIIARLGGDNYIALVKRERCQKFLAFISDVELFIQTEAGNRIVTLGSTSGIYEINEKLKSPNQVMSFISIAYQMAKNVLHVEYAYYNESMQNYLLQGQKIALDFKNCLNRGEFIFFLQPKIDLKTETLCGAEALARWKHNGSIVSPNEFIPMLEKDGNICKLDFEILRQVCEKIHEWKERGIKPVKISVNLSRWNLKNPSLVEDILHITKKYEVDPEDIELELTETVDSEEYQIMKKRFMEFKKLGFTTSIDDFGAGYSSLNLLKNLEVDVLKLDRSFLIEMEKGKSRAEILINNIIHMAGDLHLKVIAEGVETVEQKEFLKKVHCDMAQGYLYAKPLEISEFEKNLESA